MENPGTLSGGTISPFRLWPFVFDHLQDGEFSSIGNAFAIRANDGDWIPDFYRCAWQRSSLFPRGLIDERPPAEVSAPKSNTKMA
jgi:hypothetical protein